MADKKIDTGTGGANLDGKVLTYDIGVERDTVDDGPWDSGDVNVDKNIRDLSKGTKTTLADYLHRTTIGKTPSVPTQAKENRNRYIVEKNIAYVESSTTDETGYPVGPRSVPDSSFEPKLGPLGDFLENETSNARKTLPRSKWFSESGISRGINRREDSQKIDGNDLLRSAVDNEKKQLKNNHPVQNYSKSLIVNRWNSDNRFQSTSDDVLLSTPLAAQKYPLGQSFTPEDYSKPENRVFSQKQLASIGSVLMARASGEPGFNSSDFNPQNLAFEFLATTVPGLPQLAVARVEETTLRAGDVLTNLSLEADGVNDGSFKSIAPGITSGNSLSGVSILNSWGALNNPYDKFSGLGTIGMQNLAIAVILAVTTIPSIAFQGFSGGGPGPGTAPGTIDPMGRYPLGRYRLKRGQSGGNISSIVGALTTGQASITDVLGFAPTVYNFDSALSVGILSFYGLGIDRQSDQNLQTAALKQTAIGAVFRDSPEAYVVFSRSIFRNFLQFTDKLVEVFSAATASLSGFIESILGLIEFFKESSILQILNTFAQLGDQVLTESPGALDRYTVGSGARKSSIDKRDPDSGRAAFDKSRLIPFSAEIGSKNLRLAWSSFRAPDMLILPQSLLSSPDINNKDAGDLARPKLVTSLEVDDDYGIRDLMPDLESLEGGIYAVMKNDQDRIPKEMRESLEAELDSEYVPFYFHDVRTNEIISFHAFLLSLGDSYTANYDSYDAYGRVETVKTYKGTNRKIDLSFQVAALSPEDFEYMWLKLNKLTTLVYPQFSQGRISETDSFKITIPFSQQIAAAPLVRLRVGELIQSNYSKFNLARLFGYGYDDNYLKSESTGQIEESKNQLAVKAENDKKTIASNEKAFREAMINATLKPSGAESSNAYAFTANSSVPIFQKSATLGAGATDLITSNLPDDLALYPTGGASRLDPATGKTLLAEFKVLANFDKFNIPIGKDALGKFTDEQKKILSRIKRDYSFSPSIDDFVDDNSPIPPNQRLYGQIVYVPSGMVVPTIRTAALIRNTAGIKPDPVTPEQKEKIEKAGKYTAASKEFMDSKYNSVVKSFESAGGRGIAGFIESLSFDWYNQTLWETNPERGRAPKMCKVTLTFSPIHDITPGLDHKGANRAPIYPLGPHTPKR